MSFAVVPATREQDSRDVESLLRDVYVAGGFTDAAAAESLFSAPAVFERGRLLVTRDPESKALAGMVIVVPATSPAHRLATIGQVEMHLLAVAPRFRRRGLGDLLVRAALATAREEGCHRMILWTQPSMASAHRLYERNGFERAPARDFEKAGRTFLVFERAL